MNNKVNNSINVGDNSNKNTFYQGNTVNGNVTQNTYNFLSIDSVIDSLANANQYDAIQAIAAGCFSAFSKRHPLYPDYTAKFDSELQRLVSSPANEEAVKKYPRSIRGTANIDRSQCVGIDDSETPLEYAYRTQTALDIDVESMNEYLGDEIDPYPQEKIEGILCAKIMPPEFPEAVEARLEAGDVSISFMLRRVPCQEFGKLVFCNTTFEQGFDVTLTKYKDNLHNITITKTYEADLNSQLLREKLFINISQSHQIKLIINNDSLIFPYSEDDLNNLIFKDAYIWADYIQKLIIIEEKTGCVFNRQFSTLSFSTNRMAHIMANSLMDYWTEEKLDFDDEIRCNYDGFSENVLNDEHSTVLNSEMKVLNITIQGVNFVASKMYIVYKNAKVNNLSSIRKSVKKKRSDILVTLKPMKGYDKFIKKTKLIEIKVSDSSNGTT